MTATNGTQEQRRNRMDFLLSEAENGPWWPEDRGAYLWLTNTAGDSLSVDGADVAALVNAALAARHTAGGPNGTPEPPVPATEAECRPSKRADKKHGWRFDGDDPRIVCDFCGEMRDALTGRVIQRRGVPQPSDPATEAGQALLAAFSVNERDDSGAVIGHVLREDPVPMIAAIEAEARAAQRDRVAALHSRDAEFEWLRSEARYVLHGVLMVGTSDVIEAIERGHRLLALLETGGVLAPPAPASTNPKGSVVAPSTIVDGARNTDPGDTEP